MNDLLKTLSSFTPSGRVPSVMVDCAVALAMFEPRDEVTGACVSDDGQAMIYHYATGTSGRSRPAGYTTSVDDALRAVPEGWHVVKISRSNRKAQWMVVMRKIDNFGCRAVFSARSMACAITGASVKAKYSEKGE